MRWSLITCGLFLVTSQAFALSVDDTNGTISAPANTANASKPKHSVVDINAWEQSRQAQQQAKKAKVAKSKSPNLRVVSGAALVIDQTDGSLIYAKNINARQPIASITKLMTAMVVLDHNLPLDEKIEITNDDVDRIKFSHSRLKVGSTLTRFELLQLALMSSENRAASALGRTAPGGIAEFVNAMNRKASELGMLNTIFDDSTGLSDRNISTASDLALMVNAAYGYELIRNVSTAASYIVETDSYRPLQFRNSNVLVRNKSWDIGLSKTGFIREAGHCLVMQAQISTRNLIIVLLDAQDKMTRIGDANRIKKWLEKSGALKKQRIS